MCSCERGFRLVRETGECQGDVDHIKFKTLPPLFIFVDVNECEGVNDCQQRCINTVGSYNCSCQAGFMLNNDGRTCTGIKN